MDYHTLEKASNDYAELSSTQFKYNKLIEMSNSYEVTSVEYQFLLPRITELYLELLETKEDKPHLYC